ncbi:MAG TPA: hypothetical protein VGJ44_12280 [Kribbellaceae bacterium]
MIVSIADRYVMPGTSQVCDARRPDASAAARDDGDRSLIVRHRSIINFGRMTDTGPLP